jgi:coenzyme A diphosphatase NUDT7
MIDSKLPPPFRVEHICELPTNLAKTELVVRPCLAFLHSRDDASGKQADVEENMIPRLDAREVAAVFSAPFHNFLSSKDEVREGDPPPPTGKPTDWYHGQWTDWHQSKWRMHNFFVPITNQRVTHPKSKDQGQVEVSDHLKKREAEGSLTRYRVFGMTARILVDAARIAYGQEPEFEHNSHLGDEDMIRRLMKIGRLSDLRKPGDELTKEVLQQAAKI